MRTAVNVMVVEDDADVAEAVSEVLTEVGYAVEVCENGAVALDALKGAMKLPKLILLDMMMPVMDGERFLSAMRKEERLRALHVVLMTADMHALKRLSELGADEGLKKPVQRETLLAVVAQNSL